MTRMQRRMGQPVLAWAGIAMGLMATWPAVAWDGWPVDFSVRDAVGSTGVGVDTKSSASPAAAEKPANLEAQFVTAREAFGRGAKDRVKLSDVPPVEVKMLRGSPGRQWQAELGGVKFRITIEQSLKLKVDQVTARLEQLPAAYRRALAVVSEDKKDGVAFYADLDGAAAHGSQDYLNLVPDADALVIAHEAGHILEQRFSVKHPDALKDWQKAAAADGISVSDYGDGAVHEDQAEFAYIYAVCLDAGPARLAELKAKSPRRFELWERMLVGGEVGSRQRSVVGGLWHAWRSMGVSKTTRAQSMGTLRARLFSQSDHERSKAAAHGWSATHPCYASCKGCGRGSGPALIWMTCPSQSPTPENRDWCIVGR